MQMPRNFTERIVSERLLYAGGTIKVYESLVETSPGHHERLEIVEKSGDSVAILPIDDAGCVHLIREYYAAANARLYSLPKGTIEPNETPEGAALREMQEEVGFAGDLTPLARFHLSPGYLRQQTIVFLARNLQHAMTKGDERTYIQRVSIPYSRAVTMAKNGEFTEARLVAALYLAMPYIGDVVT
jgi:8-oxo-dGTP pyrophosphatase MutT (NUDIX family)